MTGMMLMLASYLDSGERILAGWNFGPAKSKKMQARKIVLSLGIVAKP